MSDCECDDGTEANEPADRGFVCKHQAIGVGSRVRVVGRGDCSDGFVGEVVKAPDRYGRWAVRLDVRPPIKRRSSEARGNVYWFPSDHLELEKEGTET